MIIKNAICLHEEVCSCNILLLIIATPSCFWMFSHLPIRSLNASANFACDFLSQNEL